MKKIYLDVCCLNRPFDDQRQDRVRLESEAVILILSHCERGEFKFITGDVVEYEIGKTPDGFRRNQIKTITSYAQGYIKLNKSIVDRSKEVQSLGFSEVDALHIASAEKACVDVFLTTDDWILKVALKKSEDLKIAIANPLKWIEKELKI